MLQPKPEFLPEDTRIDRPKPKAWIRESSSVDSRWQEYMDRFASLPTYYFENLIYPTSHREAQRILQVLNTEMENITLQLMELDTEMQALETTDGESDRKPLARLAEKKVKSLRAQRLKHSQIKVIEAWRFDRGVDIEEELMNLTERVSSLSTAMLLLMDYLKVEEETYVNIARTIK